MHKKRQRSASCGKSVGKRKAQNDKKWKGICFQLTQNPALTET